MWERNFTLESENGSKLEFTGCHEIRMCWELGNLKILNPNGKCIWDINIGYETQQEISFSKPNHLLLIGHRYDQHTETLAMPLIEFDLENEKYRFIPHNNEPISGNRHNPSDLEKLNWIPMTSKKPIFEHCKIVAQQGVQENGSH